MALDCSVVEIGVNDQLMLRQELVNVLPNALRCIDECLANTGPA